MRTHQLKSTQISEDALSWLMLKYEAVDSMNAELYRTFLSEDCELQFGNNPIVKCNNDIIGGLKHFWDSINGLDHSFLNVFGSDNHFAVEAMIDYKRKDNIVVTIPCVTAIERNEMGLSKSVKIYIDTEPVFLIR